MTSHSSLRIPTAVISIAATLALAGCAGFQTTASDPIHTVAAISGAVHGGQQPISSSHIYFYVAATNATYGAASTSLLSTAGPGVSTDTNGLGYVTSDANGNFSITSDYTCPSTTAPVYLLAVGGNPGLQPSTTNNSAITLLAVLGPCSTISSSTLADINEVTTVAAATALQQFFADPVHLGTSPNNLPGLVNSAASVANIVDRASGTARSTNLLGNGAVPQSELNTLADILSPCINTSSPSSTQCATLFNLATFSGFTAPSDVATAMLDIAQNPGSHVNNLFNLIDANAPFAPALASPPNDYTIGVTYTGGGLTSPGDLVIDYLGDAITANCPNCASSGSGTDSIVGFGPQGALLFGSTGLTANVHLPQGIAIDQENGIWVASDASGSSPDQITRFASNGNTYAGFPVEGAFINGPAGIAIDPSSNAWITNTGSPYYLSEIGPQGGAVAGAVAFGSGQCAVVYPQGIAIDPEGRIFIASTGNNEIHYYFPFNHATNCTVNQGGLNQPIGIALDSNDNIWTVDNGTNNISEINGNSELAVAGSPFPGGYQLAVLAIAGDDTVWFANCKAGCPGSGAPAGQPDNVIHLSAAAAYLTTTNGYQNPNFNGVGVAAIDFSGNLWVSNSAGGSLTELLGVAAPVVTPIAAASQYNALGIRP